MATELPLSAPMTEQGRAPERSDTGTKQHGWIAIRFGKKLVRQLLDHDIDDAGAMMAYYAVLSLFPMLVFVSTLALLVLPVSAITQGVGMATETLPAAVRQLVVDRVFGLSKHAVTGFAIGSALVALFGASRGAVALMRALDRLHGKAETRSFIRRQLVAIGVTVGVAILVVIALGLLVIGPIVGHWAMDRFGLSATFDTIWTITRWLGAGLLVMTVWAVVYKFLPNTDAPFRIFTPGAIVGVILWLGISYLFGVYLSYWGSYEATYGALGTGIIFLTWLWLSNMALLLGAEINDVLADLRCPGDAGACALASETKSP